MKKEIRIHSFVNKNGEQYTFFANDIYKYLYIIVLLDKALRTMDITSVKIFKNSDDLFNNKNGNILKINDEILINNELCKIEKFKHEENSIYVYFKNNINSFNLQDIEL